VEQAITFTLARERPAQRDAQSRLSPAVLWAWYRRYNQRQELRSLDDRMLADIGVSRAEADREARKPFWMA
jgi:uncharacterized protein YjiS (DUF1127 family)